MTSLIRPRRPRCRKQLIPVCDTPDQLLNIQPISHALNCRVRDVCPPPDRVTVSHGGVAAGGQVPPSGRLVDLDRAESPLRGRHPTRSVSYVSVRTGGGGRRPWTSRDGLGGDRSGANAWECERGDVDSCAPAAQLREASPPCAPGASCEVGAPGRPPLSVAGSRTRTSGAVAPGPGVGPGGAVRRPGRRLAFCWRAAHDVRPGRRGPDRPAADIQDGG